MRDNILPGQKPKDRPDIVCRVFKMKLDELIEDLFHNGVLGACAAFCYTIEFQKRGLPHAHILLILEQKIRPDELDKIVCAEIPEIICARRPNLLARPGMMPNTT